ncbi:MAG: hypothetical protein QM783_16740 [Phycisphaerales bacterium]
MTISLSLVTYVHVAISLIAMALGFVVMGGMLASRDLGRASTSFLTMSGLTSVTGFFFPLNGFTPAIAVGIVSLLVLFAACYARYGRRLAGRWRAGYVLSSCVLLYLNVFVLVAQLFQKVPALHDLAPKQTEPPFAATQVGLLLVFVGATALALSRFRAVQVSSTQAAAMQTVAEAR